jgi:serine phosphatase RsbU (regulator of sigma subunit)
MGVIVDDVPPERTVLHMKAGDMLIALTDGYFETEGTSGEQWQQERAESLIRAMRDATPDEILAGCNTAMQSWGAGAPAADDRTAIILKRLA